VAWNDMMLYINLFFPGNRQTDKMPAVSIQWMLAEPTAACW